MVAEHEGLSAKTDLVCSAQQLLDLQYMQLSKASSRLDLKQKILQVYIRPALDNVTSNK